MQHNGSVHGGQTNNYTFLSSGDDGQEELVVPSASSVRPIDAKFDGDAHATAIWLRKNNLHVSKNERAGEPLQSY